MILFMDGCSHYDSSQIGLKWTALALGATAWSISNDGRTDKCIKKVHVSNQNGGALTFTPLFTQNGVWAPQGTGRIGFAIKVDDLTRIASTNGGPNLFDGGPTIVTPFYGNNPQFGVVLNSNGTFTAWRNSNIGATLLGSSIQGVTSGNWAYIEIQWTLSNVGTGSIIVRSNNTTILNLQNINNTFAWQSFPSPPNLWNSLQFLAVPGAAGAPNLTLRVCDIYIADNVAPNGAFLGDISVAYIKPIGPGDVSEWTPTTAPNWDCVDGVPPNGTDTPSVSATAVSLRDSYQMQDVLGSPVAIQTVHFARKTADGAAGFKPVLRIGGVNYQSPNELTLGSTNMGFKLQPMDRSPATANPFTKAEMDAAESGQIKTT